MRRHAKVQLAPVWWAGSECIRHWDCQFGVASKFTREWYDQGRGGVAPGCDGYDRSLAQVDGPAIVRPCRFFTSVNAARPAVAGRGRCV